MGVDTVWWHRLLHFLTYLPQGGGGLGWSREDVLNADVYELVEQAKLLTEARRAEYEAHERARAQ